MSVLKFAFGTVRAGMLSALVAAVPAVGYAQALSFATTPASLYESHSLSFNGGTSYAASSVGAASLTSASTGTFWAYCIDPRTSINWSNTYAATTLSNFMSGGRYASEFAQPGYTAIAPTGYAGQNTSVVLNSLTNLYAHAYADSLTSTTRSAAFGYAVWEILGEAGYSTTAGGLRTNEVSAWRTQADAYLSALSTNSWSNVNGSNLSAYTGYTYLVYYTVGQGASQSFLRVSLPATGVSEPGTFALAAVAAFGAVGVTRRRRQAQAGAPTSV